MSLFDLQHVKSVKVTAIRLKNVPLTGQIIMCAVIGVGGRGTKKNNAPHDLKRRTTTRRKEAMQLQAVAVMATMVDRVRSSSRRNKSCLIQACAASEVVGDKRGRANKIRDGRRFHGGRKIRVHENAARTFKLRTG
ncbi:uncharacterized protein LOC116612880 [Nematostella vectensis]|uniref:uncharacterized protein LOC116612880 n=1 Tax=Nematostella vectensis TaxID=45351 RepID=UPI0020778539|nr:uncharacterized protein LOC116612880 [Nematostella vectensis]